MIDNKDVISIAEVQIRSFIESKRPQDIEVRKKYTSFHVKPAFKFSRILTADKNILLALKIRFQFDR